MALHRWNPWQDLTRMQDELSRIFGRTFGPEMTAGGMWAPATDVYEKDNKFFVTMDLPGVDPDDIDISVTDSMLRVKGERKQEKEVKEENFYRMERHYGSFERTIDLPAEVRSEGIEATFKNGKLTIELPRAEEKKGKEVKVKVE